MTDYTEPILFTMIRKLDAAGQDIAIDAYGKTFMAGSARDLQPIRNRKTGWVLRHDGKLENALRQGVLFWTPDEGYPHKKTSNFSGSFDLETPIDEFYTIKKVDGIWTILDREELEDTGQVAEAEEESKPTGFDDAEFQLKLAKRFADKLGYKGKISEKDSIKFDYASFTVYLFYKPKQASGTKGWAVGWYYKGVRHGKLELYDTAKEALLKTFAEPTPELPK